MGWNMRNVEKMQVPYYMYKDFTVSKLMPCVVFFGQDTLSALSQSAQVKIELTCKIYIHLVFSLFLKGNYLCFI